MLLGIQLLGEIPCVRCFDIGRAVVNSGLRHRHKVKHWLRADCFLLGLMLRAWACAPAPARIALAPAISNQHEASDLGRGYLRSRVRGTSRVVSISFRA